MTIFHACVGCKNKGDCGHLKEIKHQIRGLFVTSLRHRCKFREPTFNAGDPVLIRTRVGNGYEGEEPPVAIFPGHFIKQYGTKGLAFIAPNTLSTGRYEPFPFEPMNGGRGFVKVPLSRIEADPKGEVVEVEYCAKCNSRVTFVDECCCANMRDYAA